MSDWVNLQDYLALNEDAGTDMGMRVYGDVSEKASKAAQKLANDQTGYDYAVRGGTAQGPNGDASQYSQEEAEKNAANKEYTGPKSLTDYDPSLAGTVQDASQQVQAASDPLQRAPVIQETFGAQSASGVGGSALDNFLIGGSEGGQQLAQLGNQYKGLLSSLGLAEDDANAKSQAAATTSEANAKKWGDLATKKAVDAVTPKEGPSDDEKGELNQLLFNGKDENAWSALHQAGMNMNPADWATIGLGEAGIDVEPSTELFSGGFGKSFTGGEINKSWPAGKFLMAYQELVHGAPYDGPAKQAFLNFLKKNPDQLSQYLGMKNPGFMARHMRAWMSTWAQEHPREAQAGT